MITTQTKYTKEIFNDFANYSITHGKAMIINYVCAGIIIICSIFELLVKDYVFFTIDLFLGVFFACDGLIVKLSILSSNKGNINLTDVYNFDKDELLMSTHDEKGNEISSSKILYERLYKIERYKNYGFIFLNKSAAYIVKKENFDNEKDFETALGLIEKKLNQNGQQFKKNKK